MALSQVPLKLPRLGYGQSCPLSRLSQLGPHLGMGLGTGPVYLFDPATGLWRSRDAGVSWARIWARPFNKDLTGYVAASPASPGVGYVSVGTFGLFKLTGADTGTAVGNGITATAVGNFTGPGPVTIAPDGSIWVTQVAWARWGRTSRMIMKAIRPAVIRCT